MSGELRLLRTPMDELVDVVGVAMAADINALAAELASVTAQRDAARGVIRALVRWTEVGSFALAHIAQDGTPERAEFDAALAPQETPKPGGE